MHTIVTEKELARHHRMPNSPPSPPINPSTLIFPNAANSISTTLTSLKRSNLSITNRLHSIADDAEFVQRVAETCDLPLIANERCGSWYIPSACKAGSAYFKSTDGHHGQWSFSLRRLNLQVIDVMGEGGGCIIVDSTRRGKSMPDALSKTVPIWICVLNRLLFPDDIDAGELRTPQDVVSRSEHSQIEERVHDFVDDARRLALDVETLRAKLRGKPMRPFWATPESALQSGTLQWAQRREANVAVLCTASGRSSSRGSLGSAYVQGGADDSESWALGLGAATFWTHSERLLSTSDDHLPALIKELIAQSRTLVQVRPAVLIRPTSNIWIGSNATADEQHSAYEVVVSCSGMPNGEIASKLKRRYVHLSCSTGKVGSRQLRAQLVKIDCAVAEMTPTSRVLVACHTGKDFAIGVALALICLAFDDAGRVKAGSARSVLSKSSIKQRLSWIMVSMPDAAPSRATLQSVNAFLLG